MIRKLIELEETDSTNDEAMRRAESGTPHGTVVKAERQNAGKGRRGRNWQSPGGVNLYFSLYLKPSFGPDRASMLSLLMAMAVAGAIEEVCGNHDVSQSKEAARLPERGDAAREVLDIQIKWPNDVVVNRRKVCGILTELKVQGNVSHVVIGVGVNVNMSEVPAEIAGHATSLLCEYHREISREVLLTHIMRHFKEMYRIFEKNTDLAFIRKEYNQYLAGMGEEVRVLDPQGEYTGISHGITADGNLLIQKISDNPEPEMIKVYAGEVSVRGIGGYV